MIKNALWKFRELKVDEIFLNLTIHSYKMRLKLFGFPPNRSNKWHRNMQLTFIHQAYDLLWCYGKHFGIYLDLKLLFFRWLPLWYFMSWNQLKQILGFDVAVENRSLISFPVDLGWCCLRDADMILLYSLPSLLHQLSIHARSHLLPTYQGCPAQYPPFSYRLHFHWPMYIVYWVYIYFVQICLATVQTVLRRHL